MTRRLVTIIVVCASTLSITQALASHHATLACAKRPACATKAIAWQKHERARLTHTNRVLRRDLTRRFRESSITAIRVACAAYNVTCSTFYRVAKCESSLDPFAQNGGHLGLFQLGGFHLNDPIIAAGGPFDPYANALHTARYVAAHGWSHNQWECY